MNTMDIEIWKHMAFESDETIVNMINNGQIPFTEDTLMLAVDQRRTLIWTSLLKRGVKYGERFESCMATRPIVGMIARKILIMDNEMEMDDCIRR